MHEKQRLASERFREQQNICRVWLHEIIGIPGPKRFTKEELRAEAIRRWGVSKNAFDFAWIDVIEEFGRPDWYEPMRRRKQRSVN